MQMLPQGPELHLGTHAVFNKYVLGELQVTFPDQLLMTQVCSAKEPSAFLRNETEVDALMGRERNGRKCDKMARWSDLSVLTLVFLRLLLVF